MPPVAPYQIAICQPGRQPWRCLLLDHAGRPLGPSEGLRAVRGFDAPPLDGELFSAAQSLDGRWGFIDSAGEWRVPPQFDDTRNAADNGIARFCVDGLWGYMRMDGEVVVAPGFEACRPFRHGVAAVKPPDEGWRFIDETGAFTGKSTHDELGDMGDAGLARATVRDWGLGGDRRSVGFVDRRGEWVIQPNFSSAEPFGRHAVTAASTGTSASHHGLIDTQGNWVLEPQRNWRIDAFDRDGLASFQITDGNRERGFLGLDGTVRIEPRRGMRRHRTCGLARLGTQYFGEDGALLTCDSNLWMANDFRPAAQLAVVRLQEVDARDGVPARAPQWALLHRDGRVVPMPAHLREPLSDPKGDLLPEDPDTPWVAFIDRGGDLVWVDGEFGEQARLALADGQASLHTRAGQAWSIRDPGLGPVRAFFEPKTSEVLQSMDEVAGVHALLDALRDHVEGRLHRIAAGEQVAADPDNRDRDEDEWEHEHYPDDTRRDRTVDQDPALSGVAKPWREARRELRHVARLLWAKRRLSRYYLDEEQGVEHQFLASEWKTQSLALHEQFVQALSERLGPPVRLPEYAGWQDDTIEAVGWPIPLSRTLPGDDGRLPEHRQLWVGLYPHSDNSDGNCWFENWLLVAPSSDALALALRARAGARGVPEAPDETVVLDLLSRCPDALQVLPREHLSDAMIDAAVEAAPWTVQFVPRRMMTPARYATAVRTKRIPFRQVPEDMLDEGVCLAHIEGGGWGLRDVPVPLRTAAVCLQAMQHSPSVRQHVPADVLATLEASGVEVPDQATRDAEMQARLEAVRASTAQLLADPFVKLMTEKPEGPLKRLGHSLRVGGWMIRRLVFARSPVPTEHRGLTGWLERRPLLAVVSNSAFSVLAILCHVLVGIHAWQWAGWEAGVGTLLLPGLSELYWLWRALSGEAMDLRLAATAALPLIYLLAWTPLFQRIARVYARREAESRTPPP